MTIALFAARGRKNKPSVNSVNSILPLRKKMYFVSDIINTVSRFYPIIEREDFFFLFSFWKRSFRQAIPSVRFCARPFTQKSRSCYPRWIYKNSGESARIGVRDDCCARDLIFINLSSQKTKSLHERSTCKVVCFFFVTFFFQIKKKV